jgi:diguanylate cyclase (GGDEF)-like protein
MNVHKRDARLMVLAGATIALVLMWASIIGVLVESRRSAIESEQHVLERMAAVVEEQAQHFFTLIQFFMVSGDQILGRSTPSPIDPYTDVDFLNLVELFRRTSPGGLRVRLLSELGDVYDIPSAEKNVLANVRDRDYFNAQSSTSLRGFYIGRPVTSRVTGHLMLPVSYGLTAKPKGISVLAATIDVDVLARLYDEGRTKPHGTIGLVRQDGTILAHAPDGDRLVGKSIAEGDIWRNYLPHSPTGVAILPAPVIGGPERLTVYSTVQNFPLVVITSSSLDDVLAVWRLWLGGGILAGMFLTVVTILGARRLFVLLLDLSDAHAEAEAHAFTDQLTGLPNRRMFNDRLGHEIMRARRSRCSVVILFIDLDSFKEVNDSLGHHIGDILLIQTAQRLRDSVRDTDIVVRLGGDEFSVALCGLEDVTFAERIAEEILRIISAPFTLNGKNVYVTASVGIALYPKDGDTVADLLTRADQAMYAAKGAGKNIWKYFSPNLQEESQRKMRIIAEVREALACDQFLLYYQPILDLKTSTVYKAEALIRWQHPARGLVGPKEFIPVIEATEMILELGDWVFAQAAIQVARWRSSIHPEFQISINMSPAQFKNRRSSIADWGNQLSALGLPGHCIAIEITEGLLLEASEVVRTKLLQISETGFQLSLDDFGTGYSSLAYLNKFDIDYIKIDRSFVTEMEDNPNQRALCEAVIAMAHKLGLKVVAEGIETPAQLDLLISFGCDYGQGYLFSKPVPADKFVGAIDRENTPLVAGSSGAVTTPDVGYQDLAPAGASLKDMC